MLEELNGKSVLITGATTAIGAAVAKGFSRCGAEVGVHYYRSNEAAEQVAAAVRGAGEHGRAAPGRRHGPC
jgi:3-oxoacyl-[acyl-carrier protein] reductase